MDTSLLGRIELVALNVVRVTTETGEQYVLQELGGELRLVRFKEVSK